MSYLGRTELKSSDIRLKAAYAISGTSTNTVVLAWTAPSEESLIFTVNGVVQQTDAFSIAGTPTTITLASGNFADGATVEVVGINDIGTTIVPADGSVTSLKLADDAVTLAKMADDSVGVAELATTGTPDGAKFLQDDMAWTTVDSLPSQTSESGKFLTTNGSAASWAAIASSGFVQMRSLPSGTWTRPTDVTKVVMYVTGGGGGGYSGGASASCGGFSGSTAIKFLDVSSIATATILVGAAGVAGGSPTAGGNSSWVDAANTITGLGGPAGTLAASNTGTRTTATGGDINLSGGNVYAGSYASVGSYWGPGAQKGATALNPGEGGYGPYFGTGYNGGPGIVVIWEYK